MFFQKNKTHQYLIDTVLDRPFPASASSVYHFNFSFVIVCHSVFSKKQHNTPSNTHLDMCLLFILKLASTQGRVPLNDMYILFKRWCVYGNRNKWYTDWDTRLWVQEYWDYTYLFRPALVIGSASGHQRHFQVQIYVFWAGQLQLAIYTYISIIKIIYSIWYIHLCIHTYNNKIFWCWKLRKTIRTF